MKNKKVILDTNLWISFLISKKFSQIDKLIENKRIILLFSNELLEEFIDVVSRPKFEKYFSKKDIEKSLSILTNLENYLIFCHVLKNLSVDSKADYLITGDKDLLILKKVKNTIILTFSEFIEHTK